MIKTIFGHHAESHTHMQIDDDENVVKMLSTALSLVWQAAHCRWNRNRLWKMQISFKMVRLVNGSNLIQNVLVRIRHKRSHSFPLNYRYDCRNALLATSGSWCWKHFLFVALFSFFFLLLFSRAVRLLLASPIVLVVLTYKNNLEYSFVDKEITTHTPTHAQRDSMPKCQMAETTCRWSYGKWKVEHPNSEQEIRMNKFHSFTPFPISKQKSTSTSHWHTHRQDFG